MSSLFNTLLYQPIVKTLVFLYDTIGFHNFGLAVILLTILIRLILFPLFHAQAKNHLQIQRLEPQVKKIQERHRNDKQKQGEELMRLWKEHRINPATGFIMLLIQLPILLAIYKVILQELTNAAFDNFIFLGFIDLGKASLPVAVATAALQYFQVKTAQVGSGGGEGRPGDPALRMKKLMPILAPAISLIVLFRLPAALGLYWITSTAFSIGQQYAVNRAMAKGRDKISPVTEL